MQLQYSVTVTVLAEYNKNEQTEYSCYKKRKYIFQQKIGFFFHVY